MWSKTEDYLNQVYYARSNIRRLLRRLSDVKFEYERDMDACRVTQYDVVTKKRKTKSSPVEKAVILIVNKHGRRVGEMEDEITGWEAVLADVKRTVELTELDCREKEYVRLRYFENKSADSTAQSMNYSVEQARRIKRSALRKIENTINDNNMTENDR